MTIMTDGAHHFCRDTLQSENKNAIRPLPHLAQPTRSELGCGRGSREARATVPLRSKEAACILAAPAACSSGATPPSLRSKRRRRRRLGAPPNPPPLPANLTISSPYPATALRRAWPAPPPTAGGDVDLIIYIHLPILGCIRQVLSISLLRSFWKQRERNPQSYLTHFFNSSCSNEVRKLERLFCNTSLPLKQQHNV